jgi:hypothetical protein
MISDIDINKFNSDISQIKYPCIFLFRLISFIDDINDYDLSIIIRLFLKYHGPFALENNLKLLFKDHLNNNDLSWIALTDFYNLVHKKITITTIIKKLYTVYKNKIFWSMNTDEQIDYLNQIKLQFLGIYDCAKGGTPYHHKIPSLLKNTSNKYIILEDAKQRLKKLFDIFGYDVFMAIELPVLTNHEFDTLSDENIAKYIALIYSGISELLEHTIKLFDIFSLICQKMDSLFNPVIININSVDHDLDLFEDDDFNMN